MISDKLKDLSPFEFKDALIKLATSHTDRLMLNAGRGNPNFLATQPRHAFLRLGDFAMKEAERSYAYLSCGFGGMAEKDGILDRFDAYALLNDGESGVSFIQSTLAYALDHLGIAKADLLHELVEAFLGCNYPIPPRMLALCERITRVYLSTELCGTQTHTDNFDIFATEGGTAAMTYLFESLLANRILHKGDKVALISPIFSPYLEIPRIPAYDFEVIDIKADEAQEWQVPDSQLEKLLDPEVKLLFMVNPSNPPSVKMNHHFLERLKNIVEESRPDLMIVTDDVYATFSDEFRSVLSICPYNTLCVYSFSKYFGATGWRLGTMLLHNNNIFDDLIAQLQEEELSILDRRYSSLTEAPRELKFIDRLVADSRSVALNHTAGLSLPQQLQMTLFALGSLLDEGQVYKQEAKRLIRRRYDILYEAMGLEMTADKNSVDYYTILDLEQLSAQMYDDKFSSWFMKQTTGAEFIMRLADETSVVLLPGKGFDVDHPSARVSLANLTEDDYRAIGQAVKKVLEEFKAQYTG